MPRDVLQAGEQRALFAVRGDGHTASQTVVEMYIPLIEAMALRYCECTTLQRDELTQAGVAGLLHAVMRYDAELGVPFWAYASWSVRQAMQQLVSELTRPVVLSDRASRALARVRRAQDEHERLHGREATLRELASALGMDAGHIQRLIAADSATRNLDESLPDCEGDRASVADSLADPDAEMSFELVPQRLAADRLRGLMAALEQRERVILRCHFGVDGPPRTLSEIGASLELTVERIRQIEGAALNKLRLAT
jgi:RNA polymerase primary sigma factor